MRIVKALILSVPMAALPVGGLSAALVLGAFAAPAFAEEKKVSAKVGKPLQEALTLANSGKLKEAMAKAKEADVAPGKTPFDDYKVNEVIAFIAVKQGDYASAAKAYEATLKSGELAPAASRDRINQLVKIYYQLNNYPKVIEYGNEYLKSGGNDVTAAVLIAQAYFQQKDCARSIDATQSLIKMANQSGQAVREEWLQMLLNCQIRMEQDSESVATLEQLLRKYPSKQYWTQMLNYVQTHGASTDLKNLELYRLKLLNGVLKDSEYVEMAQLALALGYPGDAKAVLDKGFASNSLGEGPNKDRQARLLKLAEDNSAADIKSLPAFEKEATAAANGEGDIKLGAAFASYGDYAKAVDAIKRGIKKGNVKDVGEAQLRLGVALVGAKRYSEAVSAFKAVPADSKLASTARLWAIYAGQQS